MVTTPVRKYFSIIEIFSVLILKVPDAMLLYFFSFPTIVNIDPRESMLACAGVLNTLFNSGFWIVVGNRKRYLLKDFKDIDKFMCLFNISIFLNKWYSQRDIIHFISNYFKRLQDNNYFLYINFHNYCGTND